MATTGNDFGQGATTGNDGGTSGQGSMGSQGSMGAIGSQGGMGSGMAAGTGSQSGSTDPSTTFGRSGQRGAGSDTLGGAGSGMNRLADDAQDALERASDSASEYAERLTTTGTQLMEDARDYIAAYPMRTIGIAAAAGFLIARMMR